MKVMLGWTQELSKRWVKMDVTIELDDIRAILVESEMDLGLLRTITNNEMYQLMSNEANKFLLLDQIQQVPEHFNTEEQKDKIRALVAKNKGILAKVATRPIPEGDPWT